VGGGNRCGGRVYPVEGYYDTRWLTGLWSTQAKAEGIVLKAAWNWGRDSSVVNESGRTPLYVGLPSAWGAVAGNCIFSPHFVGGLLFLWAPINMNE
jgi:hypothetical protein